MKLKLLLAVCIVLAVAATFSISGCAPKVDGNLPGFAIGDKWVAHWHTGGNDYTVTSEITGDTVIDNQDCWIIETTFTPAYADSVSGMTNKYEKTDLDIIFSEYHLTAPGQFTTFAYKVGGTAYYPLVVGKEAQEVTEQVVTSGNETIAQSENSTTVTTTKVEKIEKITVPAGTFDCFKVLKYDDQGNLIQITWRSDKVKLFQVKMTDPSEPEAVYELVSFTSGDSK